MLGGRFLGNAQRRITKAISEGTGLYTCAVVQHMAVVPRSWEAAGVEGAWAETWGSPKAEGGPAASGGRGGNAAGWHEAREVTIMRTEGQMFRERVGFILLFIISLYCAMRIMIELKAILQPFLWALVCVMSFKPVVDSLERQIERALGLFCCCLRKRGILSRSYPGAGRGDSEEAHAELQPMISDEGALSLSDDLDAVRGGASGAVGGGGKPSASGGRLPMGSAAPAAPDVAAARARCADFDGDDVGIMSLEEGSRAAWRSMIARGLAVLIALFGTFGIISGFGFLILESARTMKRSWHVYQQGAANLTNEVVRVLGYMFQKMPEGIKTQYENVTEDVMKTAQDLLYGLLGELVNNVSSLLLGWLLTLLYTLFWLCSPVPINASVDTMFRRYIMFKTFACLGFGTCVGLLLWLLSVDLASIFALATFVLNYVPEVGPFVAMFLPCPVILFDSRMTRPFLVMLTATMGQLALKFAFSNIIEVKLIESDKKLRMHPVMILLSVGIFGYLWGPTGMLLSVPLMALLKICLFSDLVPASYRDPILVLLEGDRDAPLRHGLVAAPSARNNAQPRRRFAPPGG